MFLLHMMTCQSMMLVLMTLIMTMILAMKKLSRLYQMQKRIMM